MLSICGRNVKYYEMHKFANCSYCSLLFMTISQGRTGHWVGRESPDVILSDGVKARPPKPSP